MNRPLSMTAFGRGEFNSKATNWIIEIRSVNHRFCDIKIKIARKYLCLEEKIKKEINKQFSRGHVDVMVSQNGTGDEASKLSVNLPLAKEYHACLIKLQQELAISEPPSLQMVAEYNEIIVPQEQDEDMEIVWQEINQALGQAINANIKMRLDEGRSLKTDLNQRLDLFEATVLSIEQQIPELIAKKEATLKERLDNLLQGVDIDPARLSQEVVIIADKSDVTEELVRLKSHIQQFRAFMELDEPIGRRLDFLMQEFLREINTLASKINDSQTTHKTVDLKNEVEKIREQVQNLE